jgi:hypothetical protein
MKETVLESLKGKLSESDFILAQKFADLKFDQSEKLKVKYFQSIIDGFIDFQKEKESHKDDDKFLEELAEKLKSGKTEDLLDILDNVDIKNPKIKAILKKHKDQFMKIRESIF